MLCVQIKFVNFSLVLMQSSNKFRKNKQKKYKSQEKKGVLKIVEKFDLMRKLVITKNCILLMFFIILLLQLIFFQGVIFCLEYILISRKDNVFDVYKNCKKSVFSVKVNGFLIEQSEHIEYQGMV